MDWGFLFTIIPKGWDQNNNNNNNNSDILFQVEEKYKIKINKIYSHVTFGIRAFGRTT